jgi:hypothetical protein
VKETGCPQHNGQDGVSKTMNEKREKRSQNGQIQIFWAGRRPIFFWKGREDLAEKKEKKKRWRMAMVV